MARILKRFVPSRTNVKCCSGGAGTDGGSKRRVGGKEPLLSLTMTISMTTEIVSKVTECVFPVNNLGVLLIYL